LGPRKQYVPYLFAFSRVRFFFVSLFDELPLLVLGLWFRFFLLSGGPCPIFRHLSLIGFYILLGILPTPLLWPPDRSFPPLFCFFSVWSRNHLKLLSRGRVTGLAFYPYFSWCFAALAGNYFCSPDRLALLGSCPLLEGLPSAFSASRVAPFFLHCEPGWSVLSYCNMFPSPYALSDNLIPSIFLLWVLLEDAPALDNLSSPFPHFPSPSLTGFLTGPPGVSCDRSQYDPSFFPH